ncbi:hypothetical protein OAF38_01375, partial [bacterium]|nr:hypothetical protein [bacterium]
MIRTNSAGITTHSILALEWISLWWFVVIDILEYLLDDKVDERHTMPDPNVSGFGFATQATLRFQRCSSKRNVFAAPAYGLLD